MTCGQMRFLPKSPQNFDCLKIFLPRDGEIPGEIHGLCLFRKVLESSWIVSLQKSDKKNSGSGETIKIQGYILFGTESDDYYFMRTPSAVDLITLKNS